MARILCICPFFGIEEDKDLFLQIPSVLLTESQEIIEDWLKDLRENFYHDQRLRT